MLLVDLGGEHYMDHFDYIFASAREGYATHDPNVRGEDMIPLLDMIIDKIPGPEVEPDAPLQMLVTNLDWSEYVGRIAVGRIQAGTMKKNQPIDLAKADDKVTPSTIASLSVFDKLGRREVDEATAGDVVAVVGLQDVEIGDTICPRGNVGPCVASFDRL